MKIMKKSVSMLLSIIMILTMFTALPAAVSAAVGVEYRDANGDIQTAQANILLNGNTTLTPGWYYVPGNINFNNTINLVSPDSEENNEFNIIIDDAATLTLADPAYGFYSDDPVTLNIYSQSGGTGKIKSQNGGDVIGLMNEDASFNLYGVTVSAPDPDDDFIEFTQINCFGNITISGSVLNTSITAQKDLTINSGTINAPDITAQNITINGGNIEATDPEGDAIQANFGDGTITFNLTDVSSTVRSTGYLGTIDIQAYLTDGALIYYVGEHVNNESLKNKTIRHAGHIHVFKNNPKWEWNGYTSATATFVCSDCGETVRYTAEGDAITTKVVTAPTETTYGKTNYIATLIIYGKTYTNTKSRTTHAGNHHFGTPVWEWDGYESATLTLTCSVDGEVIVTQADVTHDRTVEPTKTTEGECVHTARATVEGTEYTDAKTEVLPMLDRSVEVDYQTLSGGTRTVTAKQILADETELTTGWYAVTESITLKKRPNCVGDVNLILCDGTTLSSEQGINVANGASLTIWGQAEGSGAIRAFVYDGKSAAIGTSQDVNDSGDEITININGGNLLLFSFLGYTPLIGCVENHSGTININKGTIKRAYDNLSPTFYIPVVGFMGDTSGEDRNYTVNITGGTINLGDISIDGGYSGTGWHDNVAIGCLKGKKCAVNITGGTISGKLVGVSGNPDGDYSVVGIGAVDVENCAINISGGSVNIASDGHYNSDGAAIGCEKRPNTCSIVLNWRSLSAPTVYAADYSGKITLYKAFKDESDNVFNAGDFTSDELKGKTLTPYCSHTYHTEPTWTWDTENEPPVATASYLCADCGTDPHECEGSLSTLNNHFNRYYTASVTIDGITYTSPCPKVYARPLDIFVGGVQISLNNYNNVFNDNTHSVNYNLEDNTLTLNNATIPTMLCKGKYYGIFYDEIHDKPFNIVLKGENTISDPGYVNTSDMFGIQLREYTDTPSYVISGDGSLKIRYGEASQNVRYRYGIESWRKLTVNGCDLDIEMSAASDANRQYGLNLWDANEGISIVNGAKVTVSSAGGDKKSCAIFNGSGNLDMDEGSTLDAFSTNSACNYNSNINLSDRTKALGVAVTNSPTKASYSLWDGETSLSSYKGVMIPKNKARYGITVTTDGYGSASCDVSSAKAGETVTINIGSPAEGRRFAFLTIKGEIGEPYNIYNNEFIMPADSVTVKANFYTFNEIKEPYVDDNGAYILGEVQHFTGPDGTTYEVLSNGCMGRERSDLSLSYFTFKKNNGTYTITKYYGTSTEVIIPKTYQGVKVTELGNGSLCMTSKSGKLNIVLNENITTINNKAFFRIMVTKVSGDTSSLNRIGVDALNLAYADQNVDLKLDYPGEITLERGSLSRQNVTVHMHHSATLKNNDCQAHSLTYDFIDEHLLDGDPTWNWADDYTAATASYACSDERCKKEATVDATVTSEIVGANCVFTATAVIGGTTYTDTKTVPLADAKYVAQVEPYIDENGAYITGTIAHYELGDRKYAVNADGSVGEEINDLTLSYFDFSLPFLSSTWRITEYTGPVTEGMNLVIPKTYNGTMITTLGDGYNKLFISDKSVNVILNENIETIKDSCFEGLNIRSIEGNTSNLKEIERDAFSKNQQQLHLYLDYPDRISNHSESFYRTDVVFHMKHSAYFSNDITDAEKVTYDFTDAHLYPDTPTWEWAADHSSATATFTCTDSRCQHQETYDATVTAEKAIDKTTYTATVTIDDKTYTDFVEVPKTQHTVTVNASQNGSVSVDKAQAYEGEKITLTVTPDDDYQLKSLTVQSADKTIPINDLSFTMPDSDVTVTAVFEQSRFAITYAETSGGWVRGVYSADKGDTVTLEVIPASGYERDTLTVKDGNDQPITVTDDEFTMPESNVTVTATFKKKDLTITYAEAEHGSVTGATTAQLNDEVTLTITPDEGYALWSLTGETEEWGEDVNFIDNKLIMPDDNITVTAEFVEYTPMKEPYIDENGEYHLGNIAYAEVNGNYFEVKDGTVDKQVDSVDLSWFDFELIDNNTAYRINYYTGPTANLSKLVIPKTYKGKPITVLGSDNNKRLYSGTKTQFELVLNENIREIGPYTFYVLYVTKVSGDTSNLKKLGNYAFSWANSPGDYSIDVQLDYPGKITVGYSVFNHMKATLRLKHATTFSSTFFNAQNVTYVFTDAHTYGEPKWSWSDDHSSATATFTCTDSRCKHQETVNATVTPDYTGDNHVYTATAELDGKTYTDTVTESHTYGDPVWKWSEEHTSATATFTCTDDSCDHKETVTATVTSETADGSIIYTATVQFDSTVYTDVQTVYTDGVGAALYGYSLSLEGDIGVNFYMELSEAVAKSDTAKMHFTIPKNGEPDTKDIKVSDAVKVKSGDKTYYVFKCQVAAKEMTSNITARIIDGNKYGELYTYSVKEYADYLIEHAAESEEWTKAVPLVKAMLNYGAYSQIHFDKNSDKLANAGLPEEDKALGDVSIDVADYDVSNLPEGTTYAGATLSLKTETTLSLYFKSSSKLSFSCDGYTVQPVTSGDYQIARIRGIKAKNIGDVFTLNVSGATVTYSPLNYCKEMIADSETDGNLKNALKAFYLYYAEADRYFS